MAPRRVPRAERRAALQAPAPGIMKDEAALAAAVAAELDSGLPPLTEAEVRAAMVLTRAELAMLAQIAGGVPPKNAQSILAAIKLKLEHTVEKKANDNDGKGSLTVIVETVPPDEETP
jgi:hypothetical protein